MATSQHTDYLALNAMLNLYNDEGQIQFDKDKEAARQFFLQNVNHNTVFFHDLEEKIAYLVDEEYYEKEFLDLYQFTFIKDLFKKAYAKKFRFNTFVSAYKFYTGYALKTFDGTRWLERYEDRVVITALFLAQGNKKLAQSLMEEMMTRRFQPATPTFLNAGRKQRGEYVSCFPAGTPVYTAKGNQDIETLVPGDRVLSHDGQYHAITEVIVNTNENPLVSITHYGNIEPLLSTPNHPVLVWTTRSVESLTDGDGADPENGFYWLEAQDVHEGDFVIASYPTGEREVTTYDLLSYVSDDPTYVSVDGYIQKQNVDKKQRNISAYRQTFIPIKSTVEETYSLGLIFGWYLSEGFVSKRSNQKGSRVPNGVHFTLGSHETAFQEELVQALENTFGVTAKTFINYSDNSAKIIVNSRVIGEFLLALLGTGFNNKRLPESLMTANLEFQKGLVHGLFRGDGHTTNGALALDLTNPELIDSVQKIMSRLGVITRNRSYLSASGKKTGQIIVPGIPGENEDFIYSTSKNLDNYVGLKGTGKNLKNSIFYKTIQGRIAYEVKAVTFTEEVPETVYNLEVEDTHTYTVNGIVVHNCFLIRVDDSMESISRGHNASLQLSKRGGGVALLLTNLRENGAPIKKIENQASGVIPVMKMLEDAFSYANQMGARNGSGAVYLNAHHPDIEAFLDTRRENADEKIRIKTLSLGIVVPDITFELAKNNEPMYLFSPYDVQRVYGKPMSDISITEHYRDMVDNPEIKKKKIKSAREFLQMIADVQLQSGYPYILFEDTVNAANPIDGRINMSNLCSEILQTNTPSEYAADLSYTKIGKDISCNLGSLNVAATMDGGNIAHTVETAVRALTIVSEISDISSVPSIKKGNDDTHAIGLGQMNLHGYLAREEIYYGSEEGIDFTNIYFYTIAYHAIKASNKLAREKKQKFVGFEKSKYATGEYFEKYITQEWAPKTAKVAGLFEQAGIGIPTQEDWAELSENVQKHGIYNAYLQAIPPTGSISYISESTASIHPINKVIEVRSEGKLGRVYYPAYGLRDDNRQYFQDAFQLGYKPIIDTYAAATQHVDQGLSLTLFFDEGATTRDLNKAQMYAWRKGIKTIYYTRLRTIALEGTEESNCVSCEL